MSEPTGDPEYSAALDRFLDGLLDDGLLSDGPADAAVRADTDAIARGLGLIGGALAAEGSGATGAAGAVAPMAGGATVVAMGSWRSKLSPRVLAAAASLIVLLGVGIPVALSSGGNSSHDSTTAAGAPSAALSETAQAPDVPAAGPQADAFGTDAAGGSGASLPSTDTGTATAGTTGTTAAAGAAPAAPLAPKSAANSDVARQTSTDAFANAVACARGILTGTITAVTADPDGRHFEVTILVEKWIVPKSGPVTVTYRVSGTTANTPGPDESVHAGIRRLFVVAASEDERLYTFREPDWPDAEKKIDAVRQERAGEGC